ncbi:sporulation protein YpjB [Thermoactinomyces mirandus]|uniref:Sporulation protein YpjB n=1 Tax=Thermoactinomyces mirandus TaxID=2756294 RepID=A0A7W2AR34_9BACL|nr:sporulation protein YpjB [Thermoactinomyces mirandus]MBA4602569.1 hypothetical protein [Thermoactinomyces mirandus]
MRGFICLLVCSVVLLPVGAGHADENLMQEKETWSGLANKVAEYINEQNYIAARNELAVLSKKFANSNLVEQKLTVPAIHTLSAMILDVERNLNQVRPNPSRIKLSALRMQIAFDAVSHSHQPLWHQYYGQLKQDTDLLMEAVHAKDEAGYEKKLILLYEHYLLIRPALIVSKSQMMVEELDSLMTVVRKEKDWSDRERGLKQWESLMHPLFYGSEKDVLAAVHKWNEGVVMQMFFLVLGMIASVLVYVGWRKYPRKKPVPN